MRRKLTVALQTFRHGGMKALLNRTKKFIDARYLGRGELVFPVEIEDILAADWTHSKPPKKPGGQKPPYRINWVVPPALNKGAGGHLNIFRFVRYLESKGHTCSLYVYDPAHLQTQSQAEAMLREHYPGMKAQLHLDRGGMDACDALIATSWETAYPVFNCKSPAAKFYFVQDFEPTFFPVSSLSVLAENTYRFGFYGITAGGWLPKKLAEYGMPADSYDFGSDFSRYSYENSGKRKKVLFYARPVTPRRGFELGVLALEIFAKENPEYEIVMAGWDISNYKLPFAHKNPGILSLEDLNGLYNETAAALVITLTNMSLLPLELIAAGCIPIVNDGENNRMVTDNKYIQYTPPTPRALADALAATVRRSDLPEYAKKASQSVQSLSWDESGERVHNILVRQLNG